MASAAEKAQLQRSASVEAEVARARLSRAETELRRGDIFRALEQAVETAFDAGLTYGYALSAGDYGYQKEARRLLDEAQSFVIRTAAMPQEAASNPPEKPKELLASAQAALVEVQGGRIESSLVAVYLAGAAVACDVGPAEATAVYSQVIMLIQSYIVQQGFAQQPQSVRKLASRLLR